MPGIFVDQLDEDLLSVKMPYHDSYLKRIRKIDGAKWEEEEEAWVLPIESAEDLDDMFEGELIYKVPRHELIEDVEPPKVPSIFKKIKEVPIKDLKLQPKDFQLFGANFLSYVLKEQKVGLLGDLMG